MKKPIIGMPCDFTMDNGRPYHRVNEKYATSVLDAIDGLPWLIPAVLKTPTRSLDFDALLSNLDGIIIPGAYSNVEPHHYQATSRPGTLHDPRRDEFTLQLIPAALKKGIPLLGICRGLQEMNVVYGGTLHQHVNELPSMMNHEKNNDLPIIEDQYQHAHEVVIEPNGLLASLYPKSAAQVNSIHGQGINRLGDGLRIEAKSYDGLIEAITDPSAKAFNLAVQWHPEFCTVEDDFYMAIYQAFAQACRQRMENRTC